MAIKSLGLRGFVAAGIRFGGRAAAARYSAVLVTGLVLVLTGRAFADPVFDIGGTMQINGTSAPNTFSQTVTLNPGTTTIDSGTLNLTQTLVNLGGGQEELILDYQTVNGGPIAGNPTGSWELQALVPLSNPSNALGFSGGWLLGGAFTGGTFPNPFSNSTLCPYTSCSYINDTTQTVDFFAFATPFDNFVTDAATVDEFKIGVVMQPVVVVPAPLIGRGLPVLLAVGGLLFGTKLLERSKRHGLQSG